jgi:hypothetical protein
MEETKFCPILKAECKMERCAWWDEDLEVCAVLSMMFALWADVDEDEDGEFEEEEYFEEDEEEDE